MSRRAPALLLLAALAAGAEPAAAPTDAEIVRDHLGGVCFRFDDNHSVAEWRDVMAVFARHRVPFCASLNAGMLPPGFDRLIRDLQAAGHEVMDHTPLHDVAVVPLEPGADPAAVARQPGVDHVAGQRVCLRHLPPTAPPTVAARLGGATLVLGERPEAKQLQAWRAGGVSVHVPALGRLLRVAAQPAAGDEHPAFTVRSAWGEAVDLGPERPVTVAFHTDRSLRMDPEAVAVLAACSLARFAALGAQRPLTWIQPGGDMLSLLDPATAQAVLGRHLGYVSAACYIDAARKVFGEPDPRGERAFGMMWGDFDLDNQDARTIRARIAEGVAQHRVLIGSSHLGRRLGGWEGFLVRLDEVAGACVAAGIPVRTQAQWAVLLYGTR